MSYPSLAKLYGKRYSWKMVLNPKTNINERVMPVLGDCNAKARDTYFKSWRKSLRRVRPWRQNDEGSKISGSERIIPSSATDPKYASMCEKVASQLSSVRQPQLSEFVEVGDVIGAGVEGVVRNGADKGCSDARKSFKELSRKLRNRSMAVKTVEKGEDGVKALQKCREMTVMKVLCKKDHPNVTSYLHTFESPINYHIVTEFNQGGDLFSYLQDHDFEPLSEGECARVMMEILCGVRYVHECGFVHLDLKLENVMRQKKGGRIDEGGVKLIDFGHASKVPKKDQILKLMRPVGSPSYAAPEIILNKTYSEKSDAWSLGVILYILFQGFLPFPHLQQKAWREFSWNDFGNFDKGIVENDPFYYENDWDCISKEGKDLCERLLQVQPQERLSIEEAMEHEWFKKNNVRMKRTDDGLPVLNANQEITREKSFSDKIVGWM